MSFFCVCVCTWLTFTTIIVLILWSNDFFCLSAFDGLFDDFSLSGLKQKGCESGFLGIIWRLLRGVVFMPALCFFAFVAVLLRGIVQLNQKSRKWFGYCEEEEDEC